MEKVTLSNLSAEQQELFREAFDKLKFKVDFGINVENEEAAKSKLEERIMAKLKAGKRLSAKEMQYLQKYQPILYMQALRVELNRKSLENQLKNARSKEEVKNIYTSSLVAVSKEDPAKQYVIASIEETIKEFKESEAYKRLPEQEEKKEAALVYEIGEDSYQQAYVQEEGGVPKFHAAT